MIRYLLSSGTAWAALLFLAVEIALPYLLRRPSPRPRMLGEAQSATFPSFRERLRPHYWLGYAIAGLSSVHAFSVGPAMSRSDAAGVWAATIAWGLLFVQVALGLCLQAGGANPYRIRRIHFWSMLVMSALVLVHVLRNSWLA